MAQTLWGQALSLASFMVVFITYLCGVEDYSDRCQLCHYREEEFKPLLELPVANIDITQNILCTFVADKYFNHTPNKQ